LLCASATVYSYLGCVNLAILVSNMSVQNDTMTPWLCISICQEMQMSYVAVGFPTPDICYCSRQLASSEARRLDDDFCDTPCPGDANSICGGKLTTSLYFINTKENYTSSGWHEIVARGRPPPSLNTPTTPHARNSHTLDFINETVYVLEEGLGHWPGAATRPCL